MFHLLSFYTLLHVLVTIYLSSHNGAMLLLSYHIISYVIFKSFVLEVDKGKYKGPKALYSLYKTVVYKGSKALLSLCETRGQLISILQTCFSLIGMPIYPFTRF